MKCVILATAFLCAVCATTQADLTHYEIGSGSSVSALNSDPGLVIHTALNPNLESIFFSLDDGDWTTFDFFDIWTDETTVNMDDLVASAVSAQLTFDAPPVTASFTGQTVGFNAIILQGGKISWDAPAVVTTGTATFLVKLSDEVFNLGLFGLSEGEKCGATVKAKVKQLSSSPSPSQNSIPAPGSAMLGVLGLGFAGWVKRRTA